MTEICRLTGELRLEERWVMSLGTTQMFLQQAWVVKTDDSDPRIEWRDVPVSEPEKDQ